MSCDLLLVDNYDSFTYNIVNAFAEIDCKAQVVRNDQVTAKECMAMNPKRIVIGPGPGTPKSAGISNELIHLAKNMPILGICLGHQCISEVFGGKTTRAKTPIHGKAHAICHQNQGIFSGLNVPFHATRYHSLITDRSTLPSCLEITAETMEGEIMGIRHKTLPIQGVQFHPESILTIEGAKLFKNFLFIKQDYLSYRAVPHIEFF